MATEGTGRPPPIILTSSVNLLKIQTDTREVTKRNSKFRTAKNGIWVVTKVMAAYLTII
jgi:RNA:NAD 2'-phosphotransferase (TPT1/KptA family)